MQNGKLIKKILRGTQIKLQAHITENYYTCTDEILAGLGKMYVADERFKKNINKYGEGATEFAADASTAYCKGEQ